MAGGLEHENIAPLEYGTAEENTVLNQGETYDWLIFDRDVTRRRGLCL
jgi:hypothetical protein